MAVQTKEIKHRLKSIKNTQKVTHTMELVSAAKMRRSISSALATRPYATHAWAIMERLLKQDVSTIPNKELTRFFTPVQKSAEKKIRTTLVLFTSNRGLCGGFNSQLTRVAMNYIQKHANEEVRLIGIGKKGVGIMSVYGMNAKLAYEKQDSARTSESVIEIARQLYEDFTNGETDKVVIAYTEFHSTVNQEPSIHQLFPFKESHKISAAVEEIEQAKGSVVGSPNAVQYLYEPSPMAVLQHLVPRMAELQLYQALLESNASEHSSRMLAMKNATDSAGEMASELLLAFNRARQDDITREISEISAGSAAIAG